MFLQGNSAKLALGDSRRLSFVHGHAGRSNSGKEAGAARETTVFHAGPAGEGGPCWRRSGPTECLARAISGEAVRVHCPGFDSVDIVFSRAGNAAPAATGIRRTGYDDATQRTRAAHRASGGPVATRGATHRNSQSTGGSAGRHCRDAAELGAEATCG